MKRRKREAQKFLPPKVAIAGPGASAVTYESAIENHRARHRLLGGNTGVTVRVRLLGARHRHRPGRPRGRRTQ